MQINNLKNSLNFKSGLNRNIVQNCRKTNISDIEMFLNNKKNISSYFQRCNTLAFLTKQTIEILDLLKEKTGAKLFNYLVPNISIYTLKKLIFNFKGTNFCIPETQMVLKNKQNFKMGSIFFEQNDNIEELNFQLDQSYMNNERSSSHYLSPFVHEFMHNVYLNYIYSKFGYEGHCEYTKEKYFSNKKQNNGLMILQKLQTLTFDENENKIIENTIGKYATGKQNQYHEVFAETFTKLICASLSEHGMPNKNPIELLKKLNPSFIVILQKIFI